jgi:hypothetical protein
VVEWQGGHIAELQASVVKLTARLAAGGGASSPPRAGGGTMRLEFSNLPPIGVFQSRSQNEVRLSRNAL